MNCNAQLAQIGGGNVEGNWPGKMSVSTCRTTSL